MGRETFLRHRQQGRRPIDGLVPGISQGNSMTFKTQTPYSLEGKTALVTGGGSGLGFAIASCFIQSGARVMIVGQTESKLVSASQELGENASYAVANINDGRRIDDLIDEVGAEFGGLDILVNNAGNHVKKSYDDMSMDEFQAVLNTHVAAGFYLTKKTLPMLRASNGGNVLFIASMVSYLGVPNVIGYTAAKSAVLGLVRGTAAEVSADGIRVNGIAPGWIKTPMSEKALDGDPERLKKILQRTPLNQMGEPSDIGWAAAYLCSNAAKFVNGHTLIVDGGAVSGF